MSRRSRRNDERPITLFSFQDIIASVTGIMILVTMLLVLELVTRKPGHTESPPPNSRELAQQIESRRKAREALVAQVRELQQDVQRLAGGVKVTAGQVEDLENRLKMTQRQAADTRQRVEQSKAELERAAQAVRDAQTEAASSAQKLAEIQRQAEEVKRIPNVTVLGGDSIKKQVYFVEIDAAGFTVGTIQGPRPEQIQQFRGGRAAADMRAWVAGRQASREFFMLLVRPDGVTNYGILHKALTAGGFELGWDLWPPEKRLFGSP